jgi:hypothetical protein
VTPPTQARVAAAAVLVTWDVVNRLSQSQYLNKVTRCFGWSVHAGLTAELVPS